MITINVTQEDIEHGERGKCHNCPISRAMQRAFGLQYITTYDELFNAQDKGTGIFAMWGKITFYWQDEQSLTIEPPNFVQQWMSDFDNYGPTQAKPFSFTIDETPFLPWVKPVVTQPPLQ